MFNQYEENDIKYSSQIYWLEYYNDEQFKDNWYKKDMEQDDTDDEIMSIFCEKENFKVFNEKTLYKLFYSYNSYMNYYYHFYLDYIYKGHNYFNYKMGRWEDCWNMKQNQDHGLNYSNKLFEFWAYHMFLCYFFGDSLGMNACKDMVKTFHYNDLINLSYWLSIFESNNPNDVSYIDVHEFEMQMGFFFVPGVLELYWSDFSKWEYMWAEYLTYYFSGISGIILNPLVRQSVKLFFDDWKLLVKVVKKNMFSLKMFWMSFDDIRKESGIFDSGGTFFSTTWYYCHIFLYLYMKSIFYSLFMEQTVSMLNSTKVVSCGMIL